VLALGNLSLSLEYHNELVTIASIEAIKQCMQSEDIETKFNAAFAMNKITINESLLKGLGECGVMPLLVHVLSTGDIHTVAQASGTYSCSCIVISYFYYLIVRISPYGV
jgi:ribosomal protein L1